MFVIVAILLAACSSGTSATPSPTPTPCSPGAPGTREVTTGNRSYLIHIPRDFVNPSPVVFAFHGRGSNAQQQLILTGLEQTSEAGRFVLVVPNAVGGRWDVEGGRDIAFVDEIIDELQCVDTNRMYASGMSMGSGFTFALACAPERRFAAFGGVALTGFQPACASAPPAPIIYFHGTKDPIVKFGGGQPQGETIVLDPVSRAMNEWARHNECTDKTREVEGKDVVLTTWTACAADADIDYYKVKGGGHTWPGTEPFIADAIAEGLGKTTQTVKASTLMWEFFEGYTLTGT